MRLQLELAGFLCAVAAAQSCELAKGAGGAPDGLPGEVAEEAVVCDPVAWVAAAQNGPFVNPEGVGDPPDDGMCRPIIEKSCEEVCDCKMVRVGCFVLGASVSSPWNRWPHVSLRGSPGCKTWTLCAFTPSAKNFSLVCEEGECRTESSSHRGASDDGYDEKIEWWVSQAKQLGGEGGGTCDVRGRRPWAMGRAMVGMSAAIRGTGHELSIPSGVWGGLLRGAVAVRQWSGSMLGRQATGQ